MSENRSDKKQKVELIKEYVLKHSKVIFPLVLVLALGIALGAGLAANGKEEEEKEVAVNAPVKTEAKEEGIPVPNVPFEENAYPEINELIIKYYDAMINEDMEALEEIVSPMTDSYRIKMTEMGKHMEACPSINIYTKPGPIEDSFLAYVNTEIQMVGYSEKTVPGMTTFYICKNEEGNYYINVEEEVEQDIADYITAVDLQDDTIDLNKKVTVAFNTLLNEDELFAKNYVQVDESIRKGIQEAQLALQEQQNPEPEEAVAEETPEPVTVVNGTKIVKTTDVVNMRSSDSEISDKLGKAQIGDTFTVLEEHANGWTKLTDGTQEFFIKSEYLEVVSEEPGQGDAPAEGNEEAQEPEEETPTVSPSLGSSGYVTAKTTVNVRKSADETSERLGVIYQGEKLELIQSQASGWCKVKYKGQTAYVKSEFVE